MSFDQDDSETATAGRSPGTGRIVVGVDGSQGSKAALEWAIGEAQVRGSSMHILVVWQYPRATSASAWGLGMDPSPDVQEAVAAASAEVASRLGLKKQVLKAMSPPRGRRSRGIRPVPCSPPPKTRTCWWWALEGTVPLSGHCSAR